MKRTLLYLLACLALSLAAVPAYAHGSGNTADGSDAGEDIQFYATEKLWGKAAFRDAVAEWNNVPGPGLVKVSNKDDAEVYAYLGKCYLPSGARWYGGVALTVNGYSTLCQTANDYKGDPFSYKSFRRISLHEWGHKYGMEHHACSDPPSIMRLGTCEVRTYHLTEHDRAYKRSL